MGISMGLEQLTFLLLYFTKENFNLVKGRELVNINMQAEFHIREIGKMI